MYAFGPGALFGIPAAAGSTPVNFGAIQDCSTEFSFTVKELYGQYQFPLAIARGQGKINCKSKAARINGMTMNNIFFGQGLTLATVNSAAIDEAATIPNSVAYTVTAAHGATFVSDMGVTDGTTGLAMLKVASGSEIAGKYSVNETTGVYTFAVDDKGKAVKLNYVYTITAGNQIAITNQLIGTTPLFKAVFQTTFLSKTATFVLNRCTSSKLTFATKLDDYTVPEFDFSAFADDSGNIGTLTFTE